MHVLCDPTIVTYRVRVGDVVNGAAEARREVSATRAGSRQASWQRAANAEDVQEGGFAPSHVVPVVIAGCCAASTAVSAHQTAQRSACSEAGGVQPSSDILYLPIGEFT